MLLATFPAPSARATINGTEPGTQIYYVGSVQEATGPEASRHLCGSVLTEDYWVLTSKQCVQGRTPESVNVRVGSRRHAGDGELISAARIIPHPTSDVALIRLSKPSSAVPVHVAEQPAGTGAEAKTLGWGQTCPTAGCGGPSAELQAVAARTEPRSACGGEGDRLCTTYPNGGGPCFGDEGGPLVSRDGLLLFGLVPSWVPEAHDCTLDRPPVIDLSALRDWIDREIR
ncbi:S1 family peptidase [Saccharothrix australiensis]|uniref:S1 family peptidase n=1 Tax=Saccharothrix australiensis TaxID=2072 RepID=UPI001477015C|nr:trypsin-like serine protease [Saccharothrix australiensis]